MFKLRIATENAAFEHQAGHEVARILRQLADKVEQWPGANDFSIGLRDANGNSVGVAQARTLESDIAEDR